MIIIFMTLNKESAKLKDALAVVYCRDDDDDFSHVTFIIV